MKLKTLLCCSILSLTLNTAIADISYAQSNITIGAEQTESMKDREKQAIQNFNKSEGIYESEKLPFENFRKALEDKSGENSPFLDEHEMSLTYLKYDEATGEPIPVGSWTLNEEDTWGTFLEVVDESAPISQRLAYKLDNEKENKDFFVLSNHDKITGSFMSIFVFENNIMQEQRLIFNLYYKDTIGLQQALIGLAQKYNTEFRKPDFKFDQPGLEVTIKGRTEKENARFLITSPEDIESLRQLFINLGEPVPFNDFLVKKAKTNLFKDIEYFKAYSSAKYDNFPYEFAVTDGIIRITDNEYKQKFMRDEEGLFEIAQSVAEKFMTKEDPADNVQVVEQPTEPSAQDIENQDIEERMEVIDPPSGEEHQQ